MITELPMSDQRRLQTLKSYEILDTPPEPAFDNIARLAAQICSTPVATVSLMDERRQWFKASMGLPIIEIDRTNAFCDYTIRGTDVMVVEDASVDPRFVDNPYVNSELHLRFYAGVPLLAPNGAALGTLAVMDNKPRHLNAEHLNSLKLLADQVMTLLELRVMQRKESQSFWARALLDSEKRFVSLFSSAAAGITLRHLNGRFIQANPAFCAIVGYSEEELLALDFQSITHPDDLETNVELVAKLLAGEIGNFVLEKRFIRKDGEIVWVRASISCVRSDDEEPVYVIAVTEDITERVTAQRVVSSLRERLAMTFDHMTDAFALLDRDWRVSFINKVGEQLVRHTADQVVNLRLWDRFPPTTSSALYTHFHQAVQDQEPVHFELFYPPLDNWFEVHAYPVPDGLAVYFRGISERKKAEEALRESEDRFRQLAETIDDVFWVWEPAQRKVIYASPRYEEVFGQSREELYSNPVSFLSNVVPDDLERIRVAYHADPFSMKLDYRIRFDDNTIRWVSVRTFPLRDESGTIRYSVAVGHDISQLMETTELLRSSHEQYRQLFANNPHPMYVYDVETLRFLAVNERAIAHYGYSEDEFLAMTILEIRPVEEIPRLLEAQNRSGPYRDAMLWKHRTKEGALIDVETYLNAIPFNGREARIVLANDVTARRRAEEQVRQQAALLDEARDAIMLCDLGHRITYWNHGAERIYGWNRTEALGQPVNELLFQDSELFLRAQQQTLAKGEWSGELAQVDRSGRELLVEARLTLVRDDDGRAQAILAINTDITERKRLEAHFLRAQRIESIGTLAGGIAHDLNNVLAPILLSLGILKRQSRTPEEHKLLATLESSAQRGADMVRQVLSFARGVDGDRIVVNVAHVVRDLENLIRDTFDRSIRIVVRTEEDLLPVLGDPTQLHQVVLNLCLNARDAMPTGGELTISVSALYLDSTFTRLSAPVESGPYVVLRVSDTGIGIPRAIRDRIFDPFFTTKEVGKGTGLGLPTVQAVVKGHGGFINVDSIEGHGSVFSIYLPALEREFTADRVTPITPLPQSNGALVLVVDDEAAIRLSAKHTLESYGYRVLTADGGVEALTIYANHRDEIAVVLTDMMMPVMDGLTTIKSLRALNPNVEIIAASGLAASDTVAKASALGVAHFLQKPFTEDALLKVIAEITS